MLNEAPATTLLPPESLAPTVELLNRLREQLDRQLLGRSQLHGLVLVAILSHRRVAEPAARAA
jgi:hypothetical protein